jgi:hypothetical protein
MKRVQYFSILHETGAEGPDFYPAPKPAKPFPPISIPGGSSWADGFGRMKFRVKWKSRITGSMGQGKPLPYEVAQSWCMAMNTEFPDIAHTVVPAEEQDDADQN